VLISPTFPRRLGGGLPDPRTASRSCSATRSAPVSARSTTSSAPPPGRSRRSPESSTAPSGWWSSAGPAGECAQRLFDQAGQPKLVIVSCEGYDPATRTYGDNVVVAKPLW